LFVFNLDSHPGLLTKARLAALVPAATWPIDVGQPTLYGPDTIMTRTQRKIQATFVMTAQDLSQHEVASLYIDTHNPRQCLV
jgi:hypothetical protein